MIVRHDDRARLEAIIGDRNRNHKHVQRARIVLLSADRLVVAEVALRAGVNRRCGAGSAGSPSRA